MSVNLTGQLNFARILVWKYFVYFLPEMSPFLLFTSHCLLIWIAWANQVLRRRRPSIGPSSQAVLQDPLLRWRLTPVMVSGVFIYFCFFFPPSAGSPSCLLLNILSNTGILTIPPPMLSLLLVVKTRLQSLNKGASEETYSGVVDCVRYDSESFYSCINCMSFFFFFPFPTFCVYE